MKYLFALALVLTACGSVPDSDVSDWDRQQVAACLAQGGTPVIGNLEQGWEYLGCGA